MRCRIHKNLYTARTEALVDVADVLLDVDARPRDLVEAGLDGVVDLGDVWPHERLEGGRDLLAHPLVLLQHQLQTHKGVHNVTRMAKPHGCMLNSTHN